MTTEEVSPASGVAAALVGVAAVLVGCKPAPAPGPDGSPCVAPAGARTTDGYGGDARIQLAATGRFRRERLCGRWWLVTPDGHPFYSVGVNSARPSGDQNAVTGASAYAAAVDALYPDHAAWAATYVDRLRSWGVNTIGSWSDHALFAEQMPFTVNLGLAGDDWQTGAVADYFSPAWREAVAAAVRDQVTPLVGSRWLVGWFLDNEIRWGPDWRSSDTLLMSYLRLDGAAAGKAVAVDFLLAELGGLDGVNHALATGFIDRAQMLAAVDAWQPLGDRGPTAAALTTGFLARVADAYFATTTQAIRAIDDRHLILGNREVSVLTRAEVYRAAAPWIDVVSINNYQFVDGVAALAMSLSGSLDPTGGLIAQHEVVDLPILITEFGFRADDAGLPNSWPPTYPRLPDQAARADALERYTVEVQAAPWIVGYHWFELVDQPVDGRFDGEDNNWGLVSEADAPYRLVTERMAATSARVADLLRVDP